MNDDYICTNTELIEKSDGYYIVVDCYHKQDLVDMYKDWLKIKKNRTGRWQILKKDGEVVNLTSKTKRKVPVNKIKSLLWNDEGDGYVVYGKYFYDTESEKVRLEA